MPTTLQKLHKNNNTISQYNTGGNTYNIGL